MIDAFISYSSVEADAARRLCSLLEENRVQCWMAPRDIPVGSHWAGSISQALRNAKLMVLLFSKHANDSTQLLREVTLAAANRLMIFPLRIDGTQPGDDMEYFLSICHWLDAPGGALENAVPELVAAIRPIRKAEASIQVQASDSMGNMKLDIYDEDMNPLETALRADAHSKGLWHKTFHCWFVSRESGEPFVWFQGRSQSKADFPGLFDITAARHLMAGESDREGINRIDTELGVTVDFENTVYLGVRQYAEKRGSFHNREFNSVYLYDSPYALTDFAPQPAEVSGLIKVAADDGLRLFSGRVAEIPAVASLYDDGKRNIRKLSVDASVFVPRVDDYYRRIFQVAIDYYAGIRPLSI
jgi:isopentenyldiphosphate isomerase